MTVRELKERLTFTEFLDWIVYLEQEERTHTKLDYYLAQLTAEVRRSWVKTPSKVNTKQFLLKSSPAGTQGKMQKSKQSWAAAIGVKVKED